MIHHGDCLEVMPTLPANSVDAIVTDPPYGLEFMGKHWDRLDGPTGGAKFGEIELADGAKRLAMPSYSGSPNPTCRTCKGTLRGNDRKGFTRCRCDSPDFPNMGSRQGLAMSRWHARWAEAAYRVAKPSAYLLAFGGTRTVHRMTVALEDAGWIIRDMLVWAYASGFPKSKASLKPAWEPIVMARKPGPLRDFAIDACRIGPPPPSVPQPPFGSPTGAIYGMKAGEGRNGEMSEASGRWPANVILTDAIFDGGIEGVVGGGEASTGGSINGRPVTGYSKGWADERWFESYGDSGTYSRFFLVPKSSRADREPILTPDWFEGTGRVSTHPTVKPIDLMRHLVRLVTPSGGTVLDPFLGSGTTGIACEMEGFDWIGIEREAEYVRIAEARLVGVQRGFGLSA